MKIILLQDVKTLGKKGEIIEANDGYARNYILPKKIGVEATSKNLNDLKLQRDYFTSKEYFDSVISKSADLKDGIIRGYLDEIYATKSSTPLISGDGKVCITPPSNPKSIFEAGNLAKKIFDNYKENL